MKKSIELAHSHIEYSKKTLEIETYDSEDDVHSYAYFNLEEMKKLYDFLGEILNEKSSITEMRKFVMLWESLGKPYNLKWRKPFMELRCPNQDISNACGNICPITETDCKQLVECDVREE